MRHGYTNQTVCRGATVRKVYVGPNAASRQAAEYRALTSLRHRFPVPRVTASGPGWLSTGFVDGAHGQDLIEAGNARMVLAECGRALHQLHALDARALDPSATDSAIIQHGDFGPNNVLFDTGNGRAAAVLDWEFSTTGDAITDLAWCEWIVRIHHHGAIPELTAFFDSYGSTPPWKSRQEEMVRRCRRLEQFTRRWDPTGPGVALWRQRTPAVEAWAG